jgi:hypothetical protein
MPLKTAYVRDSVSQALHSVLRDFGRYPDNFLTEEDVRSCIIRKLMNDFRLNRPLTTEDGSQSVPVHSEVRWYGQSGKLKFRSDIVIFDVSTLQVKNSLTKIPSKGYGFNTPIVIIEVKFRRINGESDNALIKEIKADLKKISAIKKEIPGAYTCFVFALDKKSDIRSRINGIIEKMNDRDTHITYRYARHQSFTGNNAHGSGIGRPSGVPRSRGDGGVGAKQQ